MMRKYQFTNDIVLGTFYCFIEGYRSNIDINQNTFFKQSIE